MILSLHVHLILSCLLGERKISIIHININYMQSLNVPIWIFKWHCELFCVSVCVLEPGDADCFKINKLWVRSAF